MSMPETQKSWNQGDKVHLAKVRETLRERGGRGEGGRETGFVPLLNESVHISR
jgi:hypothetical protein